MDYPRFGLIRQRFPKSPKPDPRGWVFAEFERTGLLKTVKKGHRVLLTAGSRGIDSMKDILAACVEAVRSAGGEPFIYPAMGSHGGAQAAMQVKVLTHLGITEESMGAPIYADWDIVEVGRAEGGVPVYADKAAIDANHIFIVNRVKEHTEYMGGTESGLLKMAVVGLGRQPGAENMHRLAVNLTFYKAIHAIAKVLFKELNILGGIALLEDHRNQLRRVEVVPARDVFDREPELLKESQQHRAKLPFDQMDILLVDRIGKDISGSGFDTKVIGRIMNIYEKECETPKITRIVFRDLTEGSEGNATGLGLADYTTRRVVRKRGAFPLHCPRIGPLLTRPSLPSGCGHPRRLRLSGFPIQKTWSGWPSRAGSSSPPAIAQTLRSWTSNSICPLMQGITCHIWWTFCRG
jgi:hypothetical protein